MLKAYHVQEDDEASCCIVFDTNGASARRRGARELGVEWEDIEFCRRAQWADQYAEQGEVPPKVLIEQGWKITCGCCDNRIDQDIIDDPDEDCSPVYVGGWVYYNADHHDSEVAEIKERQEIERAVRAEVEAKFPGINVVSFHLSSHGHKHKEAPTVVMRAPGLHGRVTWQHGADTVIVEKRDEAAWREYAKTLPHNGSASKHVA